MRVAAAIDTHSEHPLAQAVVKYAEERKSNSPQRKLSVKTGRGAEGADRRTSVFRRQPPLRARIRRVCSDELEKAGRDPKRKRCRLSSSATKPHEGCKGKCWGFWRSPTPFAPTPAEAIKALLRRRVEKVVMLSGDNQRTVDAISKQVGIDEAKVICCPTRRSSASANCSRNTNTSA